MQMRRLGRCVGHELRKGRNRCVALVSGDMGVGKSEFARGAIRAAALSSELTGRAITSPTFVLANSYRMPRARVLRHVDLYRISDVRELDMLGLGSALVSSTDSFIVEWPQLVQLPSSISSAGPVAVLNVSIKTSEESSSTRVVCIKCHDETSADFAKVAVAAFDSKT